MKNLKTIDADTLMTTPLPAIRYVVDQLLPQGLHILAGAPKVGKSWLALWLCLCVSKGEPLWGFACQRRRGFVVFWRTENVEKWRVKMYSL